MFHATLLDSKFHNLIRVINMSALTVVVKKVGKVLDDMATDLYELSVVTITESVTTSI